jgi:hypothetical protein
MGIPWEYQGNIMGISWKYNGNIMGMEWDGYNWMYRMRCI